MHVIFTGASVTGQSRDHSTGQVTGYTEAIKDIMPTMSSSNWTFSTKAYPGNRFSDGALIAIEEIISSAARICVVEPLQEDYTRGEVANLSHIELFYSSLLASDILPVTLLLPHQATLKAKDFPTYGLITDFCASHKLPTLEISLNEEEAAKMLRDRVHTNTHGAYHYANIMAKYLLQLEAGFQNIKKECIKIPTSNLEVKKIIVGMDASYTSMDLKIISPEGRIEEIVVLQEQLIGPHSPVVEIYSMDSNLKTNSCLYCSSIWDPYCHYERNSIVCLYRGTVEQNKIHMKLIISQNLPDYVKSRRTVNCWPDQSEMRLIPAGPFYAIGKRGLEVEITFASEE
jgi:hypothetical protein